MRLLNLDSIRIPIKQDSRKSFLQLNDWLKKTGTYHLAIYRKYELLYIYEDEPVGAFIESFSLSKMVLATLIGCAYDEDLLSLEDYLLDIIPKSFFKYPEGFEDVQIKHLLNHSSGIHPGGSWSHLKYWMAGDLDKVTSESKVKALPCEHYVYNPANFQLLVKVIEEKTGQSVTEYFNQKIAEPLNLGEMAWRTDKNSQFMGFAGLIAHPSDIAKIALLYINNGRWENSQILSGNWVKLATNISNHLKYCGRHDITIGHLYIDPATQGNFYTTGYTGHLLYGDPSNKILIVRLAKKPIKESDVLKDQMRYVLDQVNSLLIEQPQAAINSSSQ